MRNMIASMRVSASIGCSKKRSCASRQSSTDSKPSPSSRAKSRSISEAGTTRISVISTIALDRPVSSFRTNLSPAFDDGSSLSARPDVDVFAPDRTAATRRRRRSVPGYPSSNSGSSLS
jgi:hypothetical protein